MNKKFSTLVTLSLLMAGSVYNVSAQTFAGKYLGDPAKEVANGSKYILVQTDAASVVAPILPTEHALGFIDYDLQTKDVTEGAVDLQASVASWEENDYKQYVWTVSENAAWGKNAVTLTNAAYGLTLYVKDDGSAILKNYKSTTGYSTEWIWTTGFDTYKDALKATTPNIQLIPGRAAQATTPVTNYLTYDPATHTFGLNATAPTTQIKLYSVSEIEAEAGELNELYNTNGFNFDLTTKDVDNIFADQKVKAIKVGSNAQKGTDVKGTIDPLKGFPTGTYFAVSTPYGDYNSLTTVDARIDYLLNCTFIAVSPTDNATSDAKTREAGKGFKLTTVSGKDLNLFIAKNANVTNAYESSMTSGAEVSVWNAVFNVKKNYDGDKYALSLDKIRYQKAEGAAKHAEASVKLDVMTDLNYVSGKTLATVAAGASSFIFKFAEPVVEKASALLNQDGAAIYNIMFTSGYAYGSYLTDFNDQFYTKGQVLADLDAPAFQYVITNVNGTNVTFTNRETGDSFTAKLYKENDGCYSLNMQSTTVANGASAIVLDLDEDNDVTSLYGPQNLNLAHVKLIPATSTDKFNGYWNVAPETLVTLAFARDFTPTSNKLYPTTEEVRGVVQLKTYMTDDVTEAAQWQLERDYRTPYTIQTQNYAYLDANEKVVYKTKGDTVYVDAYKIRLVEDGNAVDRYLKVNGTNVALDNAANYTPFYIKQNVDGSVTIETALNSNRFLAASDYTQQYTTAADWIRSMEMENIATYPVYATNIKTYLIQDAPEISLPVETTFVTMQSEMGNYISMNEDQDGILVNVEPSTFKVLATDLAKPVPSFYVSFGKNEDGSRAYMFNPADSVNYYVGAGAYDKEYQWAENVRKVIFKDAILNETADTLTTTVKGKLANVATEADRYGTLAGLDKFKFQIVKADPEEDAYIIRQNGAYLRALNGKLTFGGRTQAVLLNIENTTAPTANEAIAAEAGVQVIGGQGVVTVQGAAGKVITVANILGQTIANQVAASDNVTIAAPAGVVVVAVDGEATKVVVK